jgi:hypothetical protein
MPGDTVYTVIHAGDESEIEKTATEPARDDDQPQSWNTRLWTSVRNAAATP